MKCEICGCELPEGTVHWRRFCLECGQARKLKLQRERQRAARGKKKDEKPKPEMPKVRTLAEVQRDAAALGLSYGQYMARTHGG